MVVNREEPPHKTGAGARRMNRGVRFDQNSIDRLHVFGSDVLADPDDFGELYRSERPLTVGNSRGAGWQLLYFERQHVQLKSNFAHESRRNCSADTQVWILHRFRGAGVGDDGARTAPRIPMVSASSSFASIWTEPSSGLRWWPTARSSSRVSPAIFT